MTNAWTRSGREAEWPALLALAGTLGAAWLMVGPWGDAPAIDDWVYAWSVEHLLATGRLRVLEFSAIYPVAQIVWGALFARVLGFSFGALRASTLVLSMFGCAALYLTLRELGCRRSTSLIGGLTLALHPIYFALTFSFMTEVPFVSFSMLALYGYVRAMRRDEAWPLWAGGAFAVAAFLVRPIAIVLPLSVLPAVICRRDWRVSARRSAAPVAAALAVMVALQVALPRMLGSLDWAGIRGSGLQWWFTIPMLSYARWTIEALIEAAFPLAPLLLAFAVQRRQAPAVAVSAGILAILSWASFGEIVTPLPERQTWTLREITARAMLSGDLAPASWAPHVVPLVKVLGLITLGALPVIALRGWARTRGWGRGESVIVAYGVLQLAAIHALWLYNDRYYIVLAPALAIAGARAIDGRGRGKWVAAGLLVLWAGIDLTGTRDMLAFNRVCAQVAHELEASGIPAWDIDAGYPLNGWRLYAHPENLPPGADPRYDVPFVTSKATTRYSLANSPLPDADVIRVVPLERVTWQATHELYVVRRHEPTSGVQ